MNTARATLVGLTVFNLVALIEDISITHWLIAVAVGVLAFIVCIGSETV